MLELTDLGSGNLWLLICRESLFNGWNWLELFNWYFNVASYFEQVYNRIFEMHFVWIVIFISAPCQISVKHHKSSFSPSESKKPGRNIRKDFSYRFSFISAIIVLFRSFAQLRDLAKNLRGRWECKSMILPGISSQYLHLGIAEPYFGLFKAFLQHSPEHQTSVHSFKCMFTIRRFILW